MKNRTKKLPYYHNKFNYTCTSEKIFSRTLGPIWDLKHVYLYRYLKLIYDK